MLRNAKRKKKIEKRKFKPVKKSLSNRNPRRDIILHNSRNLHSDQPPWELPQCPFTPQPEEQIQPGTSHRVIQHFNLLTFSIIKENNQEYVFTLNRERIIWKKDASRIDQQAYQLTVLESIKHFKVSTALKTIKVRYMFPEPIDSSQGQKPLRVNFPCIPERWEKETVKKLQKKKLNNILGTHSIRNL